MEDVALSFDRVVEWDRMTIRLCFCFGLRTPEHTQRIIQQIKCTAGCMRLQSLRERQRRRC